MVKILDCTTRDGGHTTNWCFGSNFIVELVEKLNSHGVSYYEVGYRNHYDSTGKGEYYNCTPNFLKSIYETKRNLQIGVMIDFKRGSLEDFPGIEKDYIDFVRIATHPETISKTLDVAKDLFDKGYKVFVQLMDVTNIDYYGYINLYKWEHKDILESLYIADSYGVMQPDDIKLYFDKLKALGYKKISFHAHNNKGLAILNSVEAIKCGAYSVDTTLGGIGRCGGNADFEELIAKI